MRALRWISVLLMFGALTACSSIPLGTMWKLSRMGPEALFEADPEHIRAAARSERWFLDGDSFDEGVLNVALRSPAFGEREWSFALDEVSDREAWRLDPAPEAQRWRVYRLSPDELESFQGLQRELPDLIEAARASDGENEFSLAVHFGNEEQRNRRAERGETASPVRTESVPYRVDLQLDDDEGFFTLVRSDELEVPIFGEDDGRDGESL